MEYEYYRSLWLAIKLSRKVASLTQKQLADQIGVNKKTIYEYEMGKSKPSVEKLHSIANACFTQDDEILRLARLRPETYPMWATIICGKEIAKWLKRKNITGSNYKRISSSNTILKSLKEQTRNTP